MHIENSGNEKGTSLEFSKGQFSKEKITKRIVHNEVKQEEEKILKFWDSEKIYEKSKKKNAKGNKFYFMDGPPYATGHIHMGTALNKILKDIEPLPPPLPILAELELALFSIRTVVSASPVSMETLPPVL